MSRLATVESIELVPPRRGDGQISLTGAADPTHDETAGTSAATVSLQEIAPRPHTAAAEAANVVSQQLQTSQRQRVAIAVLVLLGNMVQVSDSGFCRLEPNRY